jgi:hypothetical protein
MKQITLKVQDSYYNLFVQFLQSLNYVEVETEKEVNVELEPMTKKEILAGFAESIQDANAAMRGDKKLPSIYDVLDEIEAEQTIL